MTFPKTLSLTAMLYIAGYFVSHDIPSEFNPKYAIIIGFPIIFLTTLLLEMSYNNKQGENK